jgi:RimJ/RimL family protein N-acetyltransferase
MVKRVRSFLENSMPDTVRRIDATARADFPPAGRMLEMLGFEAEGLMKQYGPDGASHYIYARIT